ncbi:MAG: hypothetical protein AB8B84_18145 [Granulosicoccus sp.]
MTKLCTVFIAFVTLQACATSGPLLVAREQFRQGSADDALQTLENAEVSNRDQLLLFLDQGLIAQASGRYEVSKLAFEQAMEVIEELDYVSVKDQTASIITSDWAARYPGETSEQLWVHTFQMLNYLLQNSPEGAAVEARRAAALYNEHSEILKHDIFTRTLMALSFESAGQPNGARVEYRKLANDFDLEPPPLLNRSESELVVVVASGFIDPKLPGDLFFDFDARIAFPYYAPSFQVVPQATVRVNGELANVITANTALVDISQAALKARGKSVAARQALRLAAKHNMADSISDQSEVAGTIATIFLLAIEQADTRSWETLPAHMALIRVPLKPGKHTISLDAASSSNTTASSLSRIFDVELEPGQRQFKLIRTGFAH